MSFGIARLNFIYYYLYCFRSCAWAPLSDYCDNWDGDDER